MNTKQGFFAACLALALTGPHAAQAQMIVLDESPLDTQSIIDNINQFNDAHDAWKSGPEQQAARRKLEQDRANFKQEAQARKAEQEQKEAQKKMLRDAQRVAEEQRKKQLREQEYLAKKRAACARAKAEQRIEWNYNCSTIN